MDIVDRARKILLQPSSEWPVIEQEQTDPQSLYRGYIAILALIPAIAGLISRAFIASFFGVRMGMGAALGFTVVGYVLSLVMVFVVAFIADTLAPNFGGRKNLVQALKLTAYAMTASWVAGVLVIVPVLGWLASLLGALYSLYLFYLGVPALMKVPAQKALGYTAVIVVIAIVIGAVIGMLNAAMFGVGAGPMGRHY